MKVAVFTMRSVGIGIVFGVLVAASFGLLDGADWGLAAMNGLSAGAAALAFSIGMSDDRLKWYSNRPGRQGVWILAYTVMLIPAFFVERFIEVDRFIEGEKFFEMREFIDMARAYANGFAVGMLIMITAFATYGLGFINAKLEHLSGDESGDSPLLRAPPPDGPRYSS